MSSPPMSSFWYQGFRRSIGLSSSTSSGPTPPPPPPTTPTSRNSEISIPDLLIQPGRESIPKLDPSGVNGTLFGYSNNGITKSMLRMFQTCLDKAYPLYKDIPEEKRDTFFRCFAQEFNWHPSINETVKREYHSKAKRSYSSTLCEWKQLVKKGKLPSFKEDKNFWEDIITHWETEAAQETSSTNSTNRKSERNGMGLATVKCGATSTLSRRADMTKKKNGFEPSWVDTIEDLNYNKKSKTIQDPLGAHYITKCNEAKEIQLSQLSVEGSGDSNSLSTHEINKIVEEATVTGWVNHPIPKPGLLHFLLKLRLI